MAIEQISVYTTLPDAESAGRIAEILVQERLAACADIFEIDSIYRWKGEIESSREAAMFLKTNRSSYAQLETRLRELHPYEVPAIVALPIQAGYAPYLAWIDASTDRPS